MRLVCLRALCALIVVLFVASGQMTAESATASIAVTAEFASRTSLKVSSQVLNFDVRSAGETSVATVEFSAGARTRSGGDVLLTVEPLRAMEGPGGAADVDTSITFSGTGNGTVSGSLQPTSPVVAGRWTGSGLRTGQLTFVLRTTVAGSYMVPVRFVLSTP